MSLFISVDSSFMSESTSLTLTDRSSKNQTTATMATKTETVFAMKLNG